MKQVLFILMMNLIHLKRLLFIFELFKYKFLASDPTLTLYSLHGIHLGQHSSEVTTSSFCQPSLQTPKHSIPVIHSLLTGYAGSYW